MPVGERVSSSCTELSTRQYGGMSSFGGIWPRILSGAVEAARATLRGLDDSEVPAQLARIAASHGGRLPPPLAVKLLTELDANAWLRDKVAEDFEGDDGDPSWLFLHRPDRWWLSLVDQAIQAENREQEHKLEDLRASLVALEQRRALAAGKAKEHKKAAARSAAELKRLSADRRSEAVARHATESAELESLQTRLTDATASLERMELERRELQTGFDALRTRFAKARRTRGSDSSEGQGSSFVPSDPVKLARMLDLQTAAFGRDLRAPVTRPQLNPDPLALESGVRPDSSDAIRWLVGLERPVVVLVDGYNAQFHIDGSDFTSGTSRRNLVEALQRLRATATVKPRVVVVYDSTLPGSRDARTSLGGVEVRFAPDDRIADEEIIEMTADLPDVVVISSDREVREGAEHNGAVVLWSEALAAWVGRT